MSVVWKIVALTLLTIVLIVAGVGALLPSDWHVSESALILAAPAEIHPWVEDFRRWPAWATKDSKKELRYKYEGNGAGVGATQVVAGGAAPARMTITESDPQLGIKFESSRGGEVIGSGAISYREAGAMTEVTWEERGQLPSILGPFIRDPTQSQIASYFNFALSGLKEAVEGQRSSTVGGPRNGP